MDKELHEFSKYLYDWLYAEFYDEHRTCKPPPSPPPIPPSDENSKCNVHRCGITYDISDYDYDYVLYVCDNHEYISFELIESSDDTKRLIVVFNYNEGSIDIFFSTLVNLKEEFDNVFEVIVNDDCYCFESTLKLFCTENKIKIKVRRL